MTAMRPRSAVCFVCFVWLGLSGLAAAGAPGKSARGQDSRGQDSRAAEEVLKEVVMSLHASAVAPPDLEHLAEAGLSALERYAPCAKQEPQDRARRFSCRGHSLELSWPPLSVLEVVEVLGRAGRLAHPKRHLEARCVQELARALAAQLEDPYTAYLPPRMVRKLEAPTLATPGIELAPRDPSRIREVRPGSSAAAEGIQEGDRVLAIDGGRVEGRTLAELGATLSGSPGTALRLTVQPRGTSTERTKVLTRTLVPEPVVDSDPLPGGALYVRVSAFAPGAASRVAEALWQHRPRGVVLDLRHNQGGLIREGIALLDLFFSEGSIGGVRPRPGRPANAFTAGHQPTDVHAPLAVLIDGGTASASELVALVLKERGRALLLGSPSIGKGSVQKVIRLPDGGVLRITSAHYTGPSGRPLPYGGVRPDRYLAPPVARTVLEGGRPALDSWVLAALDVFEGQPRPSRAPRSGRFGPLP